MNESLRHYLDDLFKPVPQTAKVSELKEELLINMNEKYDDLIKQGLGEQEAYKQVVQGIGDIDQLISQLQPDPLNEYKVQEQRKKTSFVVAACVALYILSLLAAVMSDDYFGWSDAITAVLFLGIAAVPTCILIYFFMSRPKYSKKQDTVVEEFKEWKSVSQNRKGVVSAANSVVWTLTICLYFIISFAFDAWAVSWIIFLIAACATSVITLMFRMGANDMDSKRKNLRNSIVSLMWTLTVCLYFVISFVFDAWAVSWIIFLIAACATSVITLIFRLNTK